MSQHSNLPEPGTSGPPWAAGVILVLLMAPCVMIPACILIGSESKIKTWSEKCIAKEGIPLRTPAGMVCLKGVETIEVK